MPSIGSISNRPSPLAEKHAQYVAQLAAQGAGAAAESDRPNAATGHRRTDVGPEMIAYGVVDQTAGDQSPGEIGTNEPVAIVGAFDALETEYATLRRGAGIMDWPQRATIVIEGADRLDFLNRLMTQQLKDLVEGEARESFLINRKGRVIADVLVIEIAGRVLIDVDIFQAAAVVKTLEEFLFSEDVQIRDRAGEMYHLEAHGPKAAELLATVSGEVEILNISNLRAKAVEMSGKNVVVGRRDQIGDRGFVLLIERDDAVAVWDALLAATKSGAFNGEMQYIRPVGWFGWNIARIEAGTPLMNIDFDATCLPHETSLVKERVSFRKGCYPGQEIVARMENLGKPSKKLIGLRVAGEGLPVAGSDVYPKPKEGEANFDDPIGVITSSTLSPMLSAQPIALAMVKTKDINDGDTLMVMADGAITEATVGPMRFWSR